MSKLDTPGELIEDILKPGKLIPLDVYATIIDPLESLLKVEVAKTKMSVLKEIDEKYLWADSFAMKKYLDKTLAEVESDD